MCDMPRRPALISGRKAWNALTSSGRIAYDRALDALAHMRSDGFSLTRASKEVGTTPATVKKYAGAALQRTPVGRLVAKPSDRFYRRMTVVTPNGPTLVEIRGSRTASMVGKHANAVRKFVETGDSSDLKAFRDKRVGGQPLATDPEKLRQLARRGEVDFEDIYDLTL
jgi:hypothetical protein